MTRSDSSPPFDPRHGRLMKEWLAGAEPIDEQVVGSEYGEPAFVVGER